MNAAKSFDILCLSSDASLEEAKQSYKRLVKRWHPDQYGNDPEKQRIAHEKLKEINVAYRELVTMLKSRTAPSDLPPKSGKINRQRSGAVSDAQKGASFLKRMTSFFVKVKKNPYQFRRATAEGHSEPYRTTGEGAYDFIVGGGTSSDFSRVLRHAIRHQPKDISDRERFERRAVKSSGIRPLQSPKGAGISRTSVAPRHGRGDRVEKIRPIGRVGKIEE